jgi:beclin 1
LECISIIQAELQSELDGLSKERDAYIAFEQGIARSKSDTASGEAGLEEYNIEGTPQEWGILQRRKKDLEREEAELIAELRAKEKELAAVQVEQEAVKREEEQVEQEEEE